jgi:hypothetical protein
MIGTMVSDLTMSTAAVNADQFVHQMQDLSAVNQNAGTGNVTVVADGKIEDNDDDADYTGMRLVMTTNGGFGHMKPIDSELSQLQATNTGSGSSDLRLLNNMNSKGTLNLDGVENDAGKAEVQNLGTLEVNPSTNVMAAGDVLLEAMEGTDQNDKHDFKLSAGAMSMSMDGSVMLMAGDDLVLELGSTVHANMGTGTIMIMGDRPDKNGDDLDGGALIEVRSTLQADNGNAMTPDVEIHGNGDADSVIVDLNHTGADADIMVMLDEIGQASNDTIDVVSTASATPTTIIGGGGSDTFNIGNETISTQTGGDLDNIMGMVTVHGGATGTSSRITKTGEGTFAGLDLDGAFTTTSSYNTVTKDLKVHPNKIVVADRDTAGDHLFSLDLSKVNDTNSDPTTPPEDDEMAMVCRDVLECLSPLLMFESVGLVDIETGDIGNDQIVVNLPLLGYNAPRQVIHINGNGGHNEVMFKGSPNNDFIVVQNGDGTGASGAPFEIENMTCLHVMAMGGDDVVINDTHTPALPSFIEGGDGDDILIGSDNLDVLIGGDGTDALFGNKGDDFLFADGNKTSTGGFEIGTRFPNDLINGGEGVDSGLALSLAGASKTDQVRSIEGDRITNGAVLTVIDWLIGNPKAVNADNISVLFQDAIRAFTIDHGCSADWNLPADGANSEGEPVDNADSEGELADGANSEGEPVDNTNSEGELADGAHRADSANSEGEPADSANSEGEPADSANSERVSPPGQNPLFHEDVTNDGIVTPIDALIIINELNAVTTMVGDGEFRYYTDVNGDGQVTPIDVLRILNFLNAGNSALAEGEGTWVLSTNSTNAESQVSDAAGTTTWKAPVIRLDISSIATPRMLDSELIDSKPTAGGSDARDELFATVSVQQRGSDLLDSRDRDLDEELADPWLESALLDVLVEDDGRDLA